MLLAPTGANMPLEAVRARTRACWPLPLLAQAPAEAAQFGIPVGSVRREVLGAAAVGVVAPPEPLLLPLQCPDRVLGLAKPVAN